MDAAYVETYATVEDDHWWFRGRRRILDTVLGGLDLPAGARILEAGCGPGGNLAMLQRHGTVDAFEIDDAARAHANRRGLADVRPGALPDAVPFDGPYDVIGLFDVIEHVEDDAAALVALRDRLAPAGRLVLTVPAFMWLWSEHDVVNHHFRRYDRAGLVARLEAAGLAVEHATYFNTLLFPLVAGVRGLHRLRGQSGGGGSDADTIPPPPVNRLLERVFAAERHLVPTRRLPVGVSLLAVARRASGNGARRVSGV